MFGEIMKARFLAVALLQAQQDTLTKLTPILSPAQLEKFKVLMAERGPPGRPH
jgi:hypothetical protein